MSGEQEGNDEALQQGSRAEEKLAAPLWIAYQVVDGERIDINATTLGQACEHTAKSAWQAVCNGRGMVDTHARKVFDQARKDIAHDDATGTIVDAIASILERRAVRKGKPLRVDDTTYGVEKSWA